MAMWKKSSARCSKRPAIGASLAESDDEQDQNRLANIEELLTDARSFDEQQRPRPKRRAPAGSWRRIWSGPGS